MGPSVSPHVAIDDVEAAFRSEREVVRRLHLQAI